MYLNWLFDSGGPIVVRPPRFLAASRYEDTRSCPLREVFHQSVDPPLPLAPEARLGLAIHQLYVNAAAGRYDSSAAIRLALHQLVLAQEAEMAGIQAERHLVPLSRSVPSFFVRAAQAVRRAEELRAATVAHLQGQPNRMQGERGPYGTNVMVTSKTGDVRGAIDRVVRGRSGPELVEYKTGRIKGTDGTILARHIAQVRLYASLYEETFGSFPVAARIVSVSGTIVDVPLDPVLCRSTLADAKHLLVRINENLATDRVSAQAALAKPAPDTCGHCRFRPLCLPYRVASPRRAPWPADASGMFVQLTKLLDGTFLLVLDQGRDRVTIRQLDPSRQRHPVLHGSCGSIAAFNLKRAGESSTLSQSRLTTLFCDAP